MKWSERLKAGLLITHIKGGIRQPHNEAMGNVAKGYSRWQTASSYYYDIERILLEIKMTRSFVNQLPDEEFYKTHDINPEDYIMYHQGYFLDLVHQLKDKLCQLVGAVTNPSEKYSREQEKQATLKKLLKDKTGRLKKISGLLEALREWDDEDVAHKSPIAFALKKRTEYHHFKNPLTGTASYFQAKTHRSLLQPSMQLQLSEYGKQMITEKGKKSLNAWHTESKEKMGKTFEAIDTSLEAVSKALVEYYHFPRNDDPRAKRIFARYVSMLESISTVSNTRTISDIEPSTAKMLKGLAELLSEVLGDILVALYVTGSMVRGDFNFGLSDVNMIVILKDDTSVLKETLRTLIETPAHQWGIPTDTRIYLQSEFSADENERERFICKTDGVQIYGPDLLQYERLPNKSYKLVWMLNSDFKTKLAEHRSWIESQSTIDPSSSRAALVARDLAKRAYRMAFGQVIGNHTVYASSFKEMRRLFRYYTPENLEFLEMTYRFTQRHPWADKEGLLAMVDSYQRNLLPLYDRVNEVANGFKEELSEGENPAIPTVSAT